MHGSASPQGEARRECAGKAKRSDRRAREEYGWGWAGGVTKPTHPTRRLRLPNAQHARQREPTGEARRECAAKAERSECRAREEYGWGGRAV